MRLFAVLGAAALVVALAMPGIVAAQAPANPNAPMTGMKPDRTTADPKMREHMRGKESMLRKRRAECRTEARLRKISIFKRPAYVKKCMTH
ncbi:MAG: hypothetical protein ACREDY_18830, partial [Bradyrhizobium sp.]